MRMSISSELVTIGLPFFNNEKTLNFAIKSVLAQTYTDFELYLIDDGSTDGSYEIARKIAKTDSRVKLIRDGENKGLVSRLNQIIEIARGSYIARMDADDIMIKNKLEMQMVYLKKHPQIDVIATAAYTIDENNKVIGIRDIHPIQINSAKDVLKTSILIHPTVVAKKSWYIQNKYDPAFYRAEDYELWCRTYEKTNFYRITEPLFFYREGSVSLTNYSLSMQTLRKVFKVYGKRNLSFTECYFEIFKTYLKNAAYQVFGILRMQHFLSACRNRSLTIEQNTDAKRILSNIINCN